MNNLDIVELIAIASGYDRWLVADEPTQAAWLYALAPYRREEGNRAIVAFYSTPDRKDIRAADIVDLIKTEKRLHPHQIEADVRSARARKLIATSWPISTPLPTDVADRLGELRDDENGTQRALTDEPGSRVRSIAYGPDVKSGVA